MWTLLFFVSAVSALSIENPVVEVSNGLLKGVISENESNIEFYGVPYATITERFQAPGREPTWDGIFEANNDDIKCPQPKNLFESFVNRTTDKVIGQDDCQILNVYVPTKYEAPLPVMVIIPGGAFFFGAAARSYYGPDYLTSRGVILVSVQYRLGADGFLCLGIKEAPGNAGIKDQVAALKWIKKNIHAFGGDPENITIFGISAGGTSVGFHLLSPLSKGLFHKAIIQSGFVFNVADYTDSVHLAHLLAKTFGFDSKDPYELYNFFVNKPTIELVKNLIPVEEGQAYLSGALLGLCVEKQIDNVEALILESPYKLLVEEKYNKVPTIAGTMESEGLILLDIENNVEKLKVETTLPFDLEFSSEKEKKLVASSLIRKYIDSDTITQETKIRATRFFGDALFSYPGIKGTELFVKTNDFPVYSYIFAFDDYNIKEKRIFSPDLRATIGATHADDQYFLFNLDIENVDRVMIDKVSTMWTNFAKYGDPTPEVTDLLPVRWYPTDKDSPQSLVIDKEFSTMPLFYNDQLKYWDEVYKKYRKYTPKLQWTKEESHTEL